MSADLILANAKVITMNPYQPVARLVATKDGRILMAGDNEHLESLIQPNTKVVDCQEKTIVPGFNDAHCHLFSLMRKQLSIDLSPASVSSIADIKAFISQHVRNIPPNSWITGTDYNEFYLEEKRHPTRWDLDDVTAAHPVLLIHRSRHACVLNSSALALAGINRETEETPGTVIERDLSSGEPNGILFGMLGYITREVLPPASEEELSKGLSQVNQHYLSSGVTSLQEASVSNNLHRWKTLRQYKDAGRLKSRISMMVGIGSLSEFQDEGLSPAFGDDHLRLEGAKIILNKATGRLHPSQQELNNQVAETNAAGFQVAIHAIEQSCVESATSALEYLQHISLGNSQRDRIEHCSECPSELLKRLAKLNPIIVTQPPFIYYHGDRYLATVPDSQMPWLYRLRSLLDSGLIVAGSSDSPVVDANPLVGIYAAVNRETDKGNSLHPQERISSYQALAMYTTNAAYASHEEGIKGCISPGMLADMAVLSSNPLTSPPEQLKDIKVEMTIIGGEVIWEA